MKSIYIKFHKVLVACVSLLASLGLHAQTTTTTTTTPDGSQSTATQNANMTTTSPSSMSNMNTQGQDMSGSPHLEADINAVYAFRLRTTGVSADVGADIGAGNFLGFEYTYFHPKGSSTDAIAGRINSREDISSYEFAYRFRMPLAQFAQNGQVSPVDFYAGISGGVSSVRLKTTVPAFGFQSQSEDDGVLSGEGVVGLQWNFNRNFGLKTGYRYIYLHHVNLFGQRGEIDTSAVEVGLNLRW